MTEHVHEWTFVYGDLLATCKDFPDCNVAMYPEELVRRLNATERLKGEKAELYSCHIVEDPPFLIDECATDLRAYANILEGK